MLSFWIIVGKSIYNLTIQQFIDSTYQPTVLLFYVLSLIQLLYQRIHIICIYISVTSARYNRFYFKVTCEYKRKIFCQNYPLSRNYSFNPKPHTVFIIEQKIFLFTLFYSIDKSTASKKKPNSLCLKNKVYCWSVQWVEFFFLSFNIPFLYIDCNQSKHKYLICYYWHQSSFSWLIIGWLVEHRKRKHKIQ